MLLENKDFFDEVLKESKKITNFFFDKINKSELLRIAIIMALPAVNQYFIELNKEEKEVEVEIERKEMGIIFSAKVIKFEDKDVNSFDKNIEYCKVVIESINEFEKEYENEIVIALKGVILSTIKMFDTLIEEKIKENKKLIEETKEKQKIIEQFLEECGEELFEGVFEKIKSFDDEQKIKKITYKI